MSVANGNNTNDLSQGENMKSQNGNGYQEAGGYQGGNNVNRSITPGGHTANDDLLVIGAGHRKLANPLPLGAYLAAFCIAICMN
jgi:hypothetical protein